MWITRVSIRNPVFATMVMVGIAVLGLVAYNRLRVEQMPEVNLPFVLVLTTYPGANPEVVETDVTKPLEYAINTVAGASLIRSNSREGQSPVFAEFRMGTEMGKAMQDVRDKVAQVKPTMPRDVKDPLVIRADLENQQPVVSIAVLSPTMDLRDLTSLTDQTTVKGLEPVPGVARIDVNGRVTRAILIQIKPTAVTALGIGVDQVIAAIKNANQDVPAGRITRGQTDSIVRVEEDQGSGAIRPSSSPGDGGPGLSVAGRRYHRRRRSRTRSRDQRRRRSPSTSKRRTKHVETGQASTRRSNR
jgi:multidrug efflux pump subunit AcrB